MLRNRMSSSENIMFVLGNSTPSTALYSSHYTGVKGGISGVDGIDGINGNTAMINSGIDGDDNAKNISKIWTTDNVSQYLHSNNINHTSASSKSDNDRSDRTDRIRHRGISCPDRPINTTQKNSALTLQHSIDNYLNNVISEWDFSVVQLNRVAKGRPLVGLGMHLFNHDLYNWGSLLNTNSFIFMKYLSHIEMTYGDNIYHNSHHAADVVQSLHYLLQINNFSKSIKPLSVFAVLFSGMIHDYKHVGYTNSYLIKTDDQLALLYNDISVLENYHVSSAFSALRVSASDVDVDVDVDADKDKDVFDDDSSNSSLDFLKRISKNDYIKIRELVISLVLSTDLKLHFDILSEFKSLIHVLQENASLNTDNDNDNDTSLTENSVLMGMKIMLKCSDIGHPTKSKVIHLKWSRLIMKEFFEQGYKEKREGYTVSPLCDGEDIASIPKSQKGFINFLVKPLFECWYNYLCIETDVDVVKSTTDVFFYNIEKNVEMWDRWIEGVNLEDCSDVENHSANDDNNDDKGDKGDIEMGSVALNTTRTTRTTSTTSTASTMNATSTTNATNTTKKRKKSRYGIKFHPDNLTLLEKEYERALLEEYSSNTSINNPIHSTETNVAHSFESRYPENGFRNTTGTMWNDIRKSEIGVLSNDIVINDDGNAQQLANDDHADNGNSTTELNGTHIKEARQNRRSLPATVFGTFFGRGESEKQKEMQHQQQHQKQQKQQQVHEQLPNPPAQQDGARDQPTWKPPRLERGDVSQGSATSVNSTYGKSVSFGRTSAKNAYDDAEFHKSPTLTLDKSLPMDSDEELDFENVKKNVAFQELRSGSVHSPVRKFITSGAEFDVDEGIFDGSEGKDDNTRGSAGASRSSSLTSSDSNYG
jgi:hypothetical protein